MVRSRMTAVHMALIFLAVLMLWIAVPGSAAGKELKLAHFMPPVHLLHQKVFTPLAEDLAKASGGDLTIKIFPSEALGKGPVQQYKRAVEGVADITFCILSYTASLFPRTLMLAQPGLAGSAEEATRKLWDVYDAHLKNEYREIKLLGIWVMSPTILITRTRAVATVADMKGMKVRIGSPDESHFMQACGAVPVAMPVTEAYNALNTGIVDAVLIQPSALYKPWNLAEAAQYVTVNLPSPTSIVFLAMNPKSWNELPAKDQAVLDKLTGREFSIKASLIWSALDVEALEKAKTDSKLGYISPTESQRAGFEAAAKEVVEKELIRLEKEGIAAREIFKAISK
ncbi:MAG: TRAP transporter substrate-binding protein [Desulfobacterales bacterium]|nr:TRAP transporter substrate-binding protein [Desulfobacterales bacterium]